LAPCRKRPRPRTCFWAAEDQREGPLCFPDLSRRGSNCPEVAPACASSKKLQLPAPCRTYSFSAEWLLPPFPPEGKSSPGSIFASRLAFWTSAGPCNGAAIMVLASSTPSIPICRESVVSVHRQAADTTCVLASGTNVLVSPCLQGTSVSATKSRF
jgi:hypothetical protein